MNLSSFLGQAVNASNASEQKEAEQKLLTYLTSNPQDFLMSLAQIVGSDSENELVRQAAGTIISRNIFTKTDDGAQYKWLTYDASLTQQIKNILLATLGSEKDRAKRAASDAISKIAAVDIPLNRWDQLIPALLNAAGNQQIRNKKTAIMALGFVCVQFKQHKIAITHTQTEQIFSAIYIGLTNQNVEVKKQSLIALAPCIIYITQILKNQKFRQKTVLILLESLPIQQLTQHTLQVFIQYAKHYYSYLGQINEHLYTITSVIIQRKDQFSITAMELWHTIAEQYNENKNTAGIQNYIKLLGDKIVKLLLTNLLFVVKEDDNNVRDAAYNTLIPICECSEQTCIESVTLFVSNGLTSQDWKFRQATVMAFATLCGSENKTIKHWLEQAYDQFFSLLNDQEQFVVESTLIGFIKIFETDSNSLILLKKKAYKNYINLLTGLLNRNQNVTVKALETLGKLTECLQNNTSLDLATNIFDLLNIITQYMMKTPTPSTRELQSASIIIMHLLQGNKSNKTNKDYAEFMTVQAAKLRETVEAQNNLKTHLLILLHTAILSGKDIMSKQHAQAITAIIQTHFQAISSVDQHGLYIIGALAIRIEKSFVPFFQRLSPYIVHGLGLKKEPVTYKVCLGVISDVVKSIGQFIPSQVQAYLTCFINQFNSQGDRYLKGPLIAAIGELIRQCYNSNIITKYFPQILQIAQTSISACIHLCSTNEDPDYTEELKETLCDFLECLCSGLGKDCANKIPQIFNIALTFVLHTCCRQSNPTLNHFKKGILVVFDIASVLISCGVQYAQLVKASFSKPQFIAIFNSLKDISYTDDVKNISNYGKAIFAAIKVSGVRYIV